MTVMQSQINSWFIHIDCIFLTSDGDTIILFYYRIELWEAQNTGPLQPHYENKVMCNYYCKMSYLEFVLRCD